MTSNNYLFVTTVYGTMFIGKGTLCDIVMTPTGRAFKLSKDSLSLSEPLQVLLMQSRGDDTITPVCYPVPFFVEKPTANKTKYISFLPNEVLNVAQAPDYLVELHLRMFKPENVQPTPSVRM